MQKPISTYEHSLQKPILVQDTGPSISSQPGKRRNCSLRRQIGIRNTIKTDQNIYVSDALVEVPVEFSGANQVGKKRPLNEVTTTTAVGAVKLPRWKP